MRSGVALGMQSFRRNWCTDLILITELIGEVTQLNYSWYILDKISTSQKIGLNSISESSKSSQLSFSTCNFEILTYCKKNIAYNFCKNMRIILVRKKWWTSKIGNKISAHNVSSYNISAHNVSAHKVSAQVRKKVSKQN